MTKNQQYVAHALITFLVTLFTGFATAIIQFASSHPLDWKAIVAYAGIAFAASFTHAMLSLSVTPAQALQAFLDTVNQLTQSHMNLATLLTQFMASLSAQQQSTPVVQVNTAPVSNQPAQVVENVAPQATTTPVAPLSAVQAPSQPEPTQGAAMTATTLSVANGEQFTAPVLPVVRPQ